jgi:hypothetical protein
MLGGWFARLGRWMLHADTFALMLSPAIADVQFEAPTGVARWRLHYAMLRAFVGAFWFDISCDVLALSSDLAAIGVLTAIQSSYYAFMLVLFSGLGTERLSTLELDGPFITRLTYYAFVICVVCVVTSSACFWPPRRTSQTQVEG